MLATSIRLALHGCCALTENITLHNRNCVKYQSILKKDHFVATKLQYFRKNRFSSYTDPGTRPQNLNCSSSGNKEKESLPLLSDELVQHLERTSLVDFDNAEALSRLTEAINFADKLFEVNTDGVEPLVTVLENESLRLREDNPEATNRNEILKNASVTEEDYFVAPPGNIPLEPSTKGFLASEKN